MKLKDTINVILIIMIISIKGNKEVSEVEFSEQCFDIDSKTQLRFEGQSFATFFTTRFFGAISATTNITKYRISSSTTSKNLTIISTDKYDAGNGTYYSALDDSDTFTILKIYNTLIYSKFR